MSHAVLAPSKAPRWVPCPGSIALCSGLEDSGGAAADEGTTAHDVSARMLLNKPLPPILAEWLEQDAERAKHVMSYVEFCRNLQTDGAIQLIEHSLDVSMWTTEEGAKGTADYILYDQNARVLRIVDLKFGERVAVYAPGNEQLREYGLAALSLIESLFGEIAEIEMTIFQPRKDIISTERLTRVELLAFGEQSRTAGALALSLRSDSPDMYQHLHPTEKGCAYCPAKAICPAIEKQVFAEVFSKFEIVNDNEIIAVTKDVEDDTHIPSPFAMYLIGDWLSAKKGWIDARLRAGKNTPGWKLVLGKKGDRKFTDEDAVAERLKKMKLKKDQIFQTKLIPLTQIEKLLPKKKWAELQEFITQSPAAPIVAPASSPKEEWTGNKATVEDFQNVEDVYADFR